MLFLIKKMKKKRKNTGRRLPILFKTKKKETKEKKQKKTKNITKKKTTANSTLAIGGVSSPLDSFVVAESFVLRIKISDKNPAHRKSAKRHIPLSTLPKGTK